MTKRRRTGGYIGLLVLLIATGIAAYMWYQSVPKKADGTPDIEKQLQPIKAALDVKAANDARNARLEKMIDQY